MENLDDDKKKKKKLDEDPALPFPDDTQSKSPKEGDATPPVKENDTKKEDLDRLYEKDENEPWWNR